MERRIEEYRARRPAPSGGVDSADGVLPLALIRSLRKPGPSLSQGARRSPPRWAPGLSLRDAGQIDGIIRPLSALQCPKSRSTGRKSRSPAGTTILQACQQAGVEIPHFCYHERLAIAGNCRMCLVEVEKSPKPRRVLRDAGGRRQRHPHPVGEGQEGAPRRHGDAADQPSARLPDLRPGRRVRSAGPGDGLRLRPRPLSRKTSARCADKDFGPLVATSMNRCIHCTRCIRFLTEVAGVEELGATGRGEAMEITTYVERALDSELSANIVDLCPVGALTSKPYAFVARPWELRKTESVDVLDAVGSNIRVDARGAAGPARPAAAQRGGQRGVDLRQDPLRDRRPESGAASTGRISATPEARRGGLARSARAGRRPAQVDTGRAHRRDRRRPMRRRSDVRAEGPAGGAWRRRASIAGRTAPSSMPSCRAGYLFNTTIAGIDQADAVPAGRHQPALGSADASTRGCASAICAGGFKIARDRPALDLTYPVEQLGARRRRADGAGWRRASLGRVAAQAPRRR